jgi:uncharacterized protein
MRALLDVNMLVALLDAGHLHHVRAMNWMASNEAEGWASCPMTQNGALRILSLPAYPNPQPVARVAESLRAAIQHPSHRFWPDSLSLLDEGRLHWQQVLSSRQIADLYLLSLAVANKARLVTLDQSIPRAAVAKAQERHLLVIA